MANNSEMIPFVGELPKGWTLFRFGDILDGGTRNGIYKSKEFHGSGAKIVNMGELFAYPRLRDVEMKRVELTEKELEKSGLKSGDLLFARRSLVAEGAGKCSIVCEVSESTTFESSIIRARPRQDEFDSMFLYYLFNSPLGIHSLGTIRRQVSVSGITGSDLVKLQLPLPSFPTQQRIARILGTLDDKIELNRRMNRTLEAMAQAIFKSWFVDFEPVKAKATAKAAGASLEEIERAAMTTIAGKTAAELDQLPEPQQQSLAQTAALFSDGFQDSELGEIPKGWRVEPLGDWIDVLETGRRPKGGVSKYTSGVPSVGAESIRGIGGFEYSKTKFIPQEFFDSMKSGKVEDCDVLLYKDGGKPGDFKPRVGMLGRGFPFKEFGINEHVFRITSKSLGQPFLYFQVSSERILFDLANRGGKAAIPGINQTDVKTLDTLIPDEKVLKEFNKHCFEMIEAILSNCIQSETLAQLRDTLLPKLLSGESQLVGN